MPDPKNPQPGDVVIDASEVRITDLTPAQRQSVAKLRDGYEVALNNLVTIRSSNAALLKRAGIDEDLVDQAIALERNRAKAREMIPAVRKLLELLEEALLADGGTIAGLLSEATNQIQRRAKRDAQGDELLAVFEELIRYQTAPAQKSAATRERNKSDGDKPDGGKRDGGKPDNNPS